MESMESSCVPPGFRFHPTDEELVGYYLRKKVASQKIDLDVIRDIDLYRIEPWDLQEKCRIGYEEQKEWYFFSHKDKKYPTGTRTNRATIAGFWKATGRDKAVYDKYLKLIGMRKTLVFYKGRAPNGLKTDWIMHEYRLESDENGPPQEEGWVVCRAFKKRITGQAKAIESWESSSSSTYNFYEDHLHVSSSSIISVLDPSIINNNNNNNQENYLITRTSQQQEQPQPTNNNFLAQNNNLLFICKKEIESSSSTSADLHQNFLIKNPLLFGDLPQLESPSMPLVKNHQHIITKQDSSGGAGDGNNNGNETTNYNVTDWRALDKFVASQLSHEHIIDHRYDGNNTVVLPSSAGIVANNHCDDQDDDDDDEDRVHEDEEQENDHDHDHDDDDDDMGGLLMMESGRDEVSKFMISDFLNSTSSDCDNIGICLFDKNL